MWTWSSKYKEMNNSQLSISFVHVFETDAELFLPLSPIGALCDPGDGFTHRLHDAGHHRSGEGSWHCVGQRRKEKCVLFPLLR